MKIEIAITAVSIAVLSILIHQGAFGFYEDQLKVCNFEQVCQIVNIDDYMTKNASDKLQNNFNKDLDTFNEQPTQNQLDYQEEILQSLDTECRDNYHAFCLGESWTSLSEVLTS